MGSACSCLTTAGRGQRKSRRSSVITGASGEEARRRRESRCRLSISSLSFAGEFLPGELLISSLSFSGDDSFSVVMFSSEEEIGVTFLAFLEDSTPLETPLGMVRSPRKSEDQWWSLQVRIMFKGLWPAKVLRDEND